MKVATFSDFAGKPVRKISRTAPGVATLVGLQIDFFDGSVIYLTSATEIKFNGEAMPGPMAPPSPIFAGMPPSNVPPTCPPMPIFAGMPPSNVPPTCPPMPTYTPPERKHSHYFKDVSGLQVIDVYRVLQLFTVNDGAVAHAVKKLLCAGIRGAKDFRKDLQEAVDTLHRRLDMMDEDTHGR